MSPVYRGTWELKGRNQPNLKDVSEVYFRGSIEVNSTPTNVAPSEFVVEGQVPSGASDTAPIFIESNGLPDDQLVSVYANTTNEVEVFRAI